MTSCSVLIVDDSTDDRMLMRDILKNMSGFTFTIHQATTVGEALSKLTDESIQIVFLDYYLSSQKGTELFDSHPALKGKKPPVILLTGRPAQDVVEEAIKCGVCSIISKSNMTVATVKERIEHVLAA